MPVHCFIVPVSLPVLADLVPRGSNAEADRLADGRFDGFAPELRVHADFASVRWLVLPAPLEYGEKLYAFMRGKTKELAGHSGQRAAGGLRPKRLKLKARDPW